ncbi:hypothetical protein HYFRA_00009225 [Hymenoscyphus fraxineus]|uniref:Uncharacterized protein n=1 Tax=Hymenoscyphus fraxineus TaxID=746836 RepID=A0A9N9KW00_9HELO|nr:hypothetical protein HYFRA_00009225 [Hymenoscyphus fraxineus]
MLAFSPSKFREHYGTLLGCFQLDTFFNFIADCTEHSNTHQYCNYDINKSGFIQESDEMYRYSLIVLQTIYIILHFTTIVNGSPNLSYQRRGKANVYRPTDCDGILEHECRMVYHAWNQGKSMNLSVWDHGCHQIDVHQEPAPAPKTKVTILLNQPYDPVVVEIQSKYFLPPKVKYGNNTEKFLGMRLGGLLDVATCDNKGKNQRCIKDFKC